MKSNFVLNDLDLERVAAGLSKGGGQQGQQGQQKKDDCAPPPPPPCPTC